MSIALHLDLLAGRGGAHGFGIGAGVKVWRKALHDRAVGGPSVAGVDHVRLAPRFGCRFGLRRMALLGAMGAVELARLARRHGLEGRGRHRTQQLDDMGAAMHAAQPGAHLAMEAAADAKPDQLLEVRRHVAADPVGRLVGHRFDIDDGEFVVEGEADRHVMDEIAGLDRPAPFAGMLVGLLVGDATLDVPQPVLAEKALAGDATRVQMLSPDRWRKRHGRTLLAGYIAACMAAGGTMRNSAMRVPSRFRISKRNP